MVQITSNTKYHPYKIRYPTPDPSTVQIVRTQPINSILQLVRIIRTCTEPTILCERMMWKPKRHWCRKTAVIILPIKIHPCPVTNTNTSTTIPQIFGIDQRTIHQRSPVLKQPYGIRVAIPVLHLPSKIAIPRIIKRHWPRRYDVRTGRKGKPLCTHVLTEAAAKPIRNLLIWRRTYERIPERNHFNVAGRDVVGNSLGRTSWLDIIGSTPEIDLFDVDFATGRFPDRITYRYTLKGIRIPER